MDISQHQLDFRLLVESDADVDFLKVDIAELKALKEVQTLWPEVDNGIHLFGNSLSNAIREKGLIASYMLLYLDPQKPPYDMKGIAYLENVHVVPIVVKFSQRIEQWIATIRQSFDSRQPTSISFRITSTSTGTAYYYVMQSASNLSSLEGLEYSPIKSILHNAPRNFDPDATKLKKEEFTKSHVVAAPVLNDDEKQALKDKWQEFIKSGPEKSATKVIEFEEFESLTGFPFPSELRVIYEVSDNSDRRLGPFVMRSFSNLLLDWRDIKINFDTLSMEDLADFTETDGELTSKINCHTHRLPFAFDLNGNQVAYGLIPGKKGRAGQIVAIENRPERVRWIAGSLTEFIELLNKEHNEKKQQSKDAEAYVIDQLREPMRELNRAVFLYKISSPFSKLKKAIFKFLGK